MMSKKLDPLGLTFFKRQMISSEEENAPVVDTVNSFAHI